eukprot:3868572-Pleurochrysis_carterae.AAC.2
MYFLALGLEARTLLCAGRAARPKGSEGVEWKTRGAGEPQGLDESTAAQSLRGGRGLRAPRCANVGVW